MSKVFRLSDLIPSNTVPGAPDYGESEYLFKGSVSDAIVELAILEITHGDGQALLDIYSTRTEIAAQKGRSEENYKDLITNMKNERSKRVTVLHAGTKENVFLIFTDSDNRKILGVIPGYKPS